MAEDTTLSRSVAGAVVLITGAGSGMGRATARVFAEQGARVAVTDRDTARARAVAEALCEQGHEARAWALDVTDGDRVRAVVDGVASHFGGLDILINNAGVTGFAALEDDQYGRVWHSAIAVLLTAQQSMVRAALPHLRQAAHPRIVNIASTEALGATPGNSAYAAAKAGVAGFTRALAVDLGKLGITVNCLCPGPIDTEMTGFIDPADKALFARRRTALRRYGRPEEIAHMTLSVCLPAASYLTGAVIPVDGGLMARNA
ncbi:3-oxoacyl-ACP reductase [Alcanivorax sp. N3-2A]|nr:3-oxoacyl-ACP reductase [Alcanivorax sp. N3-2A]|tara:strand:+ start:52356 stop:53135 length:780 start_codon:yes stop_codon:yes gene_type:complete